MPKREIKIDAIRWDATDLQARADGVDATTVAHYADRMTEGEEFPPITLFHDGTDHWPADGWHTAEAARKAGYATIDANVIDGTRDDAWEYAHTEANAKHGRPMSPSDKRKKVAAYINRHPDYADNRIAEKCHVGFHLVKSVREKLPDHVRAREPEKRTGADGKSYPSRRQHNGQPVEAESTDVPVGTPTGSAMPAGDRASVIRSTVPFKPDTPKRPAPFVDRFDELFGALIRFIDDAARHHNVMNGTQHQRALASLGNVTAAYQAMKDAA